MRRMMAAAATAVWLASAMAAQAADVTRILVGFPPGQATDLVARLIAEKLSPMLSETVIVENRPGQGASLALATLAKAPRDGHTMVLAPLASLVSNPHLYRHVGYDTLQDFEPVARVADLPMLMVVNPSLPVHSVAELIAYAKAHPDKLTHPSSGSGTLSHLGMEDFKRRAGIHILHVPYQGSPQAMTDLMSGQVNVAMDTVAVTQPFIRSGKMRLLATTYATRVPGFPDTPTLAESGFSGYNIYAWLGVLVPAGTPKERVAQLSAAIAKAVASPDVGEKLALMGALPHVTGPDGFRTFLTSEYERWGKIVKESGLNKVQ